MWYERTKAILCGIAVALCVALSFQLDAVDAKKGKAVTITYTFSEGGWILNGSVINGVRGFVSPPVALVIENQGTGPTGATAVHALPPIEVGKQYVLRTQIKRQVIGLGTQAALRIEVWSNGNGRVLLGTQFPGAVPTSDFGLKEVGSFTNPGFDPTSFFILITPVTFTVPASTRYVLDDIELQGVEMKKWTAISVAVDVLKTINGGAFNSALGSRVYTRIFLPNEQPGVKLPYVCFPLAQEAEVIAYEGLMFQSTWRLTGHAFFDDNIASDLLNSSGATSSAEFRDDLIRAFMLNPNLSGATLESQVISVETSAGVMDDGISEVIFTVEFTQYGSAADLVST